MASPENEALTLAEFDPLWMGPDRLKLLGGGVLDEMGVAFGYSLSPEPAADELRAAIKAVGSAKTFQDNVGQAQEALGAGADAVEIASDWINRFGLLTPVERPFSGLGREIGQVDVAVAMGGMHNWMVRKDQVLRQAIGQDMLAPHARIVLAGGTRTGGDLPAGTTEGDYYKEVVAPKLREETQRRVDVVTPNTDKGKEVAMAVARILEPEERKTLVAAVAGNWAQDGAQIIEARQERNPLFAVFGDDLSVKADGVSADGEGFRLGDGIEPAGLNVQDPFRALSMIPRAALALRKNMH